MPDIVQFYTGEKPILKNVPTWRCSEPSSLAYVLEHLCELVVKEVHGSGGYGMLVGFGVEEGNRGVPREADGEARQLYRAADAALDCRSSRAPAAPRHVDLRPFVLMSPEGIEITPGG